MSPPDVRRHTCFLSDREVTVIERALKAYHDLLKIQTSAPSPREADDIVHASALIQAHKLCTCPFPHE